MSPEDVDIIFNNVLNICAAIQLPLFYGGIMTCIMNCGLAMSFAFPYRYLLLAYPDLVNNIKRFWGSMLFLAIHVSYSILFCISYKFSMLSYDDYPDKEELPPRQRMFCFEPAGWRKNTYLVGALVVLLLTATVINTFSVLLGRHLSKMKDIMSKKTLELHRKFLLYLLITTAVPVGFGGMPLFVCLLCSLFPHLPYNREMTMVSICVFMNHGTIYSIVSIVTFAPYYNAVKKMFRGFLGKPSVGVTITIRSSHY
ncbi:hypothetical protein QR680_003618 [Steinernema hermaphroditum]|uniref:Uncharacterized protein n=1 Tax=Steinernema hermaphroditum TaxID=289476 RepID=A0AA39LSK2_9BILA|nr:hypothetical protein QR680_003618 [Steinernema hermaphroditum]